MQHLELLHLFETLYPTILVEDGTTKEHWGLKVITCRGGHFDGTFISNPHLTLPGWWLGSPHHHPTSVRSCLASLGRWTQEPSNLGGKSLHFIGTLQRKWTRWCLDCVALTLQSESWYILLELPSVKDWTNYLK